jgi:hypothetical protein
MDSDCLGRQMLLLIPFAREDTPSP